MLLRQLKREAHHTLRQQSVGCVSRKDLHGERSQAASQSPDDDLDAKGRAGGHVFVEMGLLYGTEVDRASLILFGVQNQYRPDLRHRLDQERGREIAGVARESAEEESGLGSPNHTHHAAPRVQLHDFVDKKKRISVRQDALDLRPIQNEAHWGALLVPAGASRFPVKTRKY